jgi:endonuclease/exonuclease/phosphatase family metal-dependent hydrolase
VPKERAVQRILSLATLVGLGAAVWMFLSGGGLNQLAVDPATGQPGGSGSVWNGGPAAPGYGNAPYPTAPAAQPTTYGGAAPPLADGPTFRIASFNIEAFGTKKTQDARVYHTLAEIVRQFEIVAIQEIRTSDEYLMPNFVKLINSKGRRYDFVLGPPIGNSTTKERYAFVFDAERIMVDPNSVYTVGDPDNLLHREPLVASFSTRMPPSEAFTFILVNVHTDPDVAPAELEALGEAFRAVRRASRGEDDVIMLGDFNADDVKIARSRLGQIPGVTPLVRGVFSNTRQDHLYDNLVVHLPSTTECVGRSGVFNVMERFKLTAAEAELVSNHLPVYAEFSAYERDYTGGIASRRTSTR